MRADIENLVNSVEKSLELLRQRMDWDTASNRLEEYMLVLKIPIFGMNLIRLRS